MDEGGAYGAPSHDHDVGGERGDGHEGEESGGECTLKRCAGIMPQTCVTYSLISTSQPPTLACDVLRRAALHADEEADISDCDTEQEEQIAEWQRQAAEDNPLQGTVHC